MVRNETHWRTEYKDESDPSNVEYSPADIKRGIVRRRIENFFEGLSLEAESREVWEQPENET